jgi:outer membrane protein TolC
MVTLDLPIAPGKRQDRRVAEKRINEDGARLAAEDLKRELEAGFRAARAAHDALAARLRIYARDILPDARRAAEVTVAGFARDQAELREARMQEIEARLDARRLEIELAKSRAQLLYFTGESQP